MSPTIAYMAQETQLFICFARGFWHRFSATYRFDQVRRIVVDHANGCMRGDAISSSSEVQVELRRLRRGDSVYLQLITPERKEYEGRAEVMMLRLRANRGNAIILSFVFRLRDRNKLAAAASPQ